MSGYVFMICDRCRKRRERWSNARFCSCGGRLTRTEPPELVFAAATGAVLRRARLKAGLTARQLAASAGLSASFLSDVENGKRGLSLENWVHLTMRLDGRFTALLGEVVALWRGQV